VTGAELAARRTAAAAVLADFRREESASLSFGGASGQDWLALAQRLAWALGDVLAEPDHSEQDHRLAAGQLAVLGQALADAIACRTPQGICPDCDAYLALARELGIEVAR
jgi:hypothetical protein